MKLRRREYRQLKIEYRKNRVAGESGQVSWVWGLFLLLFLMILLCMQMQVEMYRASSMYLEDALALSNLASAVIDIREYGTTEKVLITDPELAYERYCHALQENLGLNNAFEAKRGKLLSGTVKICNYTIYNVVGEKVEVWQKNDIGQIQEWQGDVGEVRTPAGQVIEATGVYSEITYPVEGFLGIRVMAKKGKLVDVVRKREGQGGNEDT